MRLIFSLLILVALSAGIVPGLASGQDPGPAWVINGTAVYYDDVNVYLSADPHTIINDGWVEFRLVSKSYSGPIDAVWGFDPALNLTPRNPERWAQNVAHRVETPTVVDQAGNITLDGITDYGPVSWDDYTPDIGNENNAHLYRFASNNGTLIIAFNSYDQHSDTSATLYYNADATETVVTYDYYPDWKPFTNLEIGTVDYSYQGIDTWKVAQFDGDIVAGKEYRVRVWVDVPFTGLSEVTYKYIWAIKPGTETIAQAVGSGHLYMLDPWISSGYTYRKSHTVNNATGAGVNYTVDIVVNSGSGSDSGNVVYLNNHCTDFPDDLTFTDGDQVTELSHYCADLTADPATFSVRITDDLSSTDQQIYIYYGKSGGTSQSDGPGTFMLFEDGSFTGWTEEDAHNWYSADIGGAHGDVVKSPTAGDFYTYCYKPFSYSAEGYKLSTDLYLRNGYYGNYYRVQMMYARNNTASPSDFNYEQFYRSGTAYQKYCYAYCDGSYQLSELDAYSWDVGEWDHMDIYVDTDPGDITIVYDSETLYDVEWDRPSLVTFRNCRLSVRRVESWWDNLIVRKWVDPEPGHGSWGSEETESAGGSAGYAFGYIVGG